MSPDTTHTRSLFSIYAAAGDTPPLHLCHEVESHQTTFLLQEGTGYTKNILVIGESPALNGRILSNKAFYTVTGKLVPSGKRFNTLFAPYGICIEHVAFTELCKCVVGPHRHLLKTCSHLRYPHLLQQIVTLQPKLIILLGKHTSDIFQSLISTELSMGELTERVYHDAETCDILPIYHTSPINPQGNKKNVAILERQGRFLKHRLDSAQ